MTADDRIYWASEVVLQLAILVKPKQGRRAKERAARELQAAIRALDKPTVEERA